MNDSGCDCAWRTVHLAHCPIEIPRRAICPAASHDQAPLRFTKPAESNLTGALVEAQRLQATSSVTGAL